MIREIVIRVVIFIVFVEIPFNMKGESGLFMEESSSYFEKINQSKPGDDLSLLHENVLDIHNPIQEIESLFQWDDEPYIYYSEIDDNEGIGSDDDENNPIGDGLLCLLCCCLIYVGIKKNRNKRATFT